MKILKIFGIVVGIHIFALVLIFANPGCSSTTKSTPAPTDTVSQPPSNAAPIPAPITGGYAGGGASSAPPSAPISFNPDAPAVAAPGGAGGRSAPTRPGTPVAGVLVSEPVVDVTPATAYTVVSGDNLYNLAKKHHVTVAELAAANGIKANAVLRPGQKLIIPGKPASPAAAAMASGKAGPTPKATEVTPPAATPRASGEPVKHTVKSGETLGAIARMYGVKAGDIAVANNISDPAKIKANDQLVIPGWQAPGAKAGKSSKAAGTTKSGETKTTTPAEQSTPPAQTPPPVPVIRIDESPITPAPKP
jgi:LysM repeat protein